MPPRCLIVPLRWLGLTDPPVTGNENLSCGLLAEPISDSVPGVVAYTAMPPWVRLPTRPDTVVSDVPPPVTGRLACFAAGRAAEAEAEASPAAGASIRPAAVAMAAIRRIARMGFPSWPRAGA